MSGMITRNRGLVMAILIVALPAVIVLRLPTWSMDILLSINLTLSVVVLLTTIFVRRPLEFSVFPSMLLLTTLYRLVLNVATTRLILSNARPGPDAELAAGRVIRAFGKFVAGENALVGFVIFAIIIVVQFVVITKGATRISEVAARFTLDGMPGKQMSIDADLNAGLITEQEARERRAEISREADFYGAMDGASKYVRGDAIAGILITLINIIGGLVIGMMMYSFSFGEAVQTYTRLTIGDGLVSQIPAFFVSVAAGLIITRSTASESLGDELLGQMVGQPRALYVAAGFLALMSVTGLPMIPMLVMSGACVALGTMVSREQAAKARQARLSERTEAQSKRPAEPEEVESMLRVDPMELEVGYGLIRLVDPKQGGDLLDRVSLIRRQLAGELGIVVPPIRIRDNMQLGPNEYRIKIRGNRVATGTAMPEKFLAMDSGLTTGTVDGIETTEPAFGLRAVWIMGTRRTEAESRGYAVVDAPTVIGTHLTETIKRHADEILSRQDVANLVENLKERCPALVAEIIPGQVTPGQLHKVLQNLLREGITIRSLDVILETLGDASSRTKDVDIMSEYVRNSLARSICQTLVDEEGKIHVVTLDPKLEEVIAAGTEHTEQGSFLTLRPAMIQKIARLIEAECGKLTGKGYPAVVLCSPQVRLSVKRLTEATMSQLVVVSYNEIVKDVEVESEGMVVTE